MMDEILSKDFTALLEIARVIIEQDERLIANYELEGWQGPIISRLWNDLPRVVRDEATKRYHSV